MESTGENIDDLSNEVENERDGVVSIPRLANERIIHPNSDSNIIKEDI